MVLLSLLWVPSSLYAEYMLQILPEVGSGSSLWMNQSLLKYLADQRPLAQLAVFIGVTGLGVFLWFISRKRRPGQTSLPQSPLAEKDLQPLAAFSLNLLVIFIFTGSCGRWRTPGRSCHRRCWSSCSKRASQRFQSAVCPGSGFTQCQDLRLPAARLMNLWGPCWSVFCW
jgi:hypothetical protein